MPRGTCDTVSSTPESNGGDTHHVRPQSYATVFCTCGWLMAGSQGDQVYCENPKCKEAGKIFKLQIYLQEVVSTKQ